MTSFDSSAAHLSQMIWAFVTDKPAAKQVLPESLKPFCEKYSVPFLPTETLNDFETETTPFPVNVVSSENFDADKSSVFRGLEVGKLSIILRVSTTTFI